MIRVIEEMDPLPIQWLRAMGIRIVVRIIIIIGRTIAKIILGTGCAYVLHISSIYTAYAG